MGGAHNRLGGWEEARLSLIHICTGFYFIARDSMSRQQVLDLLREAFLFISEFVGQIPGASKPECGNYLDHDLNQAKAYARTICQVLEGWTPERMDYEG